MSPQVATIVLNYQSADDTRRCLRALARSAFRNQFLVVVDNGSGGDDVTRLRQEFGTATFVVAPDNLGYAGGNNLGVQLALEAGVQYVLMLNPDTVVEPTAVGHLVRIMEAQPEIGILGPRLVKGGTEPRTIWFDGGHVDLERGGETWHEHDGEEVANHPPGPPQDTGYVTGAAMMVRADVFSEVGLLPEEYFLYFEETAFNLLAQAAGWRTVVAPEAVVHHYKRSSGRLPQPYYVYYFVRSRLLFGTRFSPLPFDAVLTELQQWIDAWDAKVTRADPGWVDTYRELVRMAIDDARAGRTGRRDLRVPLPT